MNDYKVINSGVWSGLTEVRIYDETITHVKEEHPEVPIELPCVSTAIDKAIVNPTHIEKSYGNSVVIVDAETTNAGGDPLRIPVKIIEGTSGRARSVYSHKRMVRLKFSGGGGDA